MSYGLTTAGFVVKHLQTIKTDIETKLKAEFGDDINLASDSVFGKIVGTMAQPLADLWEQCEAVYNAFYPSTSEGTSLSNCVDLVGLTRIAATRSETFERFDGNAGVTIPAGTLMATAADDQYRLKAALTLTATSVAVQSVTELISLSITPGQTFTIQINSTSFQYTASPGDDADDVSAGLETLINAGAEPVTATDLTGGKVQVDGDTGVDGYPTAFTVDVTDAPATLHFFSISNLGEIESVETGPVLGYADTITTIITQVDNWKTCTNPKQVTLGSNAETDAALRIRRNNSLAIVGASTVEAIQAKLLEVEDVTYALVIENVTDATVDDIPPHAIECVVENGADADIAEAIWTDKAGGIQTYGHSTEKVTVVVTDSQGFTHDINFTRVKEIDMDVNVNYTKYDEESFPTDGEDLIKAAVLATGIALTIGNDVLPERFFGPIFTACAGIATLEVQVKEDGVGAYQTTPFDISNREISKFDPSRITATEV